MRIRLALFVLIAVPLAAQEPHPAVIVPAYLESADGVSLTLDWRYAPGDELGRALPEFDDSRWAHTSPLDPRGWTGSGWFRRHVAVARELGGRTFAVTIAAPGIAQLFVDGALVTTIGRSGFAFLPASRRDTELVTLREGRHVIAVHYTFPLTAPRPVNGIGFRVSLARPVPESAAPFRDWRVAAHGALVALPLFLAFLHFSLFAFDRRARENLFYGAEMLVFAVMILHEYRSNFLSSDRAQSLVDEISSGGPIAAIFFGMLTYYAVRMDRLPRSWRLFGAIGAALLVASYTVRGSADFLWMIYFAAMIAEIVRTERSGRTVHREGTGVFLVSFIVFGAAIVLQIFVNFNFIESIAGVREVYVFGIVASAIGMSLYLAQNLGRSRVVEIENERKSEELARARRLQMLMLPRELPRVAGLDVAVGTQTAAEVGGDYYDVRTDGDGSLLFAFGDATGHGLPSGILVTVAKALFISLPSNASLGAHLVDFSRTLRSMNLPPFLRMCLSLARVSPREAVVASAAMPPVLIHRVSDRSIVELGRGDLPLGSRLAAQYRDERAPLEAGDTLLFASDGFAEQSRSDGQQFGYEAVAQAFRDACDASDAKSIVDRLFATAHDFRGTEPLHDDVTLLVVRVSRV